MKHPFKPLATALAATLQLTAIAAVPLAWDARPGNPAPASFDRYHGEALEFRCTFRGSGALPFPSGADIRLWYQTNGMGSAWWSAPATIQSNVLSATWSPARAATARRRGGSTPPAACGRLQAVGLCTRTALSPPGG